MDLARQWMMWLFVLILIFVLLSPQARVDEVIKTLARFQVRTIAALQGERP